MSNFSFLATPSSLTYTNLDGKTQTVTNSHPSFNAAKDLIKQIQALIKDDDDYEDLIEQLDDLIAPVKKITASGQVSIVNGVLYYNGQELHNAVTERILWGISEGFEMQPYISFLENLMQNVSYRSIQQLFTFMEKHKMGITDDGHILGYKRVTNDFKDVYTKKIDNSPGQYVTMPRNQVSDDPASLCSSGLHFCSMDYLPSYGVGSENTIVIVKVNPKDVVSIPNDHENAKARCCAYLVLSEYTGSDKDDLLAKKAVFSTNEFTGYEISEQDEDDWTDSYSESEWEDSEYQEDETDDVQPVDNKDWEAILNNLESRADELPAQPIVEEKIEPKTIVQPDLFNTDSAQNISDLLKDI
jgi:hypothetical protein